MGASRMDHAQAWDAVRAVVAREHVSVQDEPAGIIDVVLIHSGAGSLLVGGRCWTGTAARAAASRAVKRHPVAAGDVLHIPARMPHGYLVPDGGHVTYVLVRTPAFVP